VGERTEFHFVGLVQRADKRTVSTSEGEKPKYDVFAVGAGPDSNVTNPRRIALWRWKKGTTEDAPWWALLEEEIKKAVGLGSGDPVPLRFSGFKTARDEGSGHFYDATKVEAYDPAVHTTSDAPTNGAGSGGAGAAPGRATAPTTDPTAVTVADGIRALEVLLPRMPKTIRDQGTGEERDRTPAEQSEWLHGRAVALLRVARRAAYDVSSEAIRPPEGGP
jgi:hypothetical protein